LKELGLSRDQLEGECLHKGEGCSHCFGSGYKGRHGIYELMPLSGPIKRQLLKSADAIELQRAALSSGMVSLRGEGALLALRGITSSAEVLRATRCFEEG